MRCGMRGSRVTQCVYDSMASYDYFPYIPTFDCRQLIDYGNRSNEYQLPNINYGVGGLILDYKIKIAIVENKL